MVAKHSVGRFALRACAALIALGLSTYVIISLVAAEKLTRASNGPHSHPPSFIADQCEPWQVLTGDGLTLRGWFFPARTGRELIVCVHGMHSNWSELARIGRDIHHCGYNLLMFDLRGHGGSDPARLSMGRRERVDLRAVVAWAEKRGFEPGRIGWLGHSMGASTLLMEGAGNTRIGPTVLDSPYGNLPELLDTQLTEHSGLPRLFNPGIMLAARLAFGIRTDDLVPIREAAGWRGRPLLVIHGENDTMVPVRHARQIALAAGPSCQIVTLPNVDHVDAYNADPEGYIATLDRFFRRHLGGSIARGQGPERDQRARTIAFPGARSPRGG